MIPVWGLLGGAKSTLGFVLLVAVSVDDAMMSRGRACNYFFLALVLNLVLIPFLKGIQLYLNISIALDLMR